MNPVRLLLAENQTIVRQSLCELLIAQPELAVIGATGDGLELLELVSKLRPEVVVMGLELQGLNGLEAARQIHRRFPSVKIVILSGYSNPNYVARALRAGALGYVLKEEDILELLTAIHSSVAGKSYLSARVQRDAVEELLAAAPDGREPGEPDLSDRERQVLQLIGEGYSKPQIALRLGISQRTVDAHRGRLMKKLRLASQAELLRFAVQSMMLSDNSH